MAERMGDTMLTARGKDGTLGGRFVTAPVAARYLGVSANTFRAKIRPLIAVHDFGTPEAPIQRFAVADLDAWAASRRRERRSA